ncbi:MAG: hypothetical protein J5780_00965, partial [Treponema sp.]|nr:hypothetical protein [Treponema sp.]
KTPAIAQEAKKAAEEMTQKWKEKPAELKTQIETFSSSVKDLQSLNTSSLSDPVKIKDAITKIDSALKQSEKIKSSFDGTMESFKTDSSSVTGLSKQLTDALKEDKAFISSEMGKFAGVVKNPSELIGNAVSSVGYNMLGKYYPYAQKLLDLALEAKRTAAAQNKTAKPQKEKQESKRKRMEGTTFWYASDYPGFLIERIYASGPDFEGTVLELSSNPDIRNKPATADVKFRLKDIDHNGKLTVDARSETSAPLIAASYSGKGFDAAINGEKISSGSGIPSISGKTSLYFDAQGGTDGFTVSGGVDVNPAVLTSDGFSNETLSKYYITALSSIKKVALKFTAGFNEKEGLVFDINGNLTEAFTNAFTAAAKEAVGDAGKLAAAKLNEKINSANSESVAKIKDFLGIQNDFDVQNASLKNLQSQLETKKKELEAKASGKAKDAASGALEKAGVNTKAAGKATDKAADKLKKLF